MLRLKNLANKYQKRTCRPLYANTQATPYAATLYTKSDGSAGFRAADGSLQIPSGAYKAAGSGANSVPAGIVLVRVKGTDQVTIATGAAGERPFGLLANFVGGDLDEGFAGDSLQNQVGAWRGPDSTFEILAPAFGTIAAPTVDGTSGNVYLYAGSDGRLTTTAPDTSNASTEAKALGAGTGIAPTGSVPVARLIEVPSTSRIIVDLLV